MEKQADTKRDLWTMLEEYGHSDYYPMHMPGHKRRGEAVCGSFPWSCDITEIDGFDDLHDPQGVLREIELHAESLWGSEQSWASGQRQHLRDSGLRLCGRPAGRPGADCPQLS